MARILVILGTIAVIGGGIGLGGLFSSLTGMFGMLDNIEAKASDYCREGEQLVQRTGTSSDNIKVIRSNNQRVFFLLCGCQWQ